MYLLVLCYTQRAQKYIQNQHSILKLDLIVFFKMLTWGGYAHVI